MAFVHLHTHSEYSLLDGANSIPALVGRVRELGMDALAVTDHGNLHAACTFYREARRIQVQPILGFEAYLAFGSRLARERDPDAPGIYSHLVLLARDRTGYRNLCRLSSIGFVEGFYHRPRIDRESLERHQEGLLCLSGCLSGEVALWLRRGRYERAKAAAAYFARLFDGNFWLEVQNHGLDDERVVSEGVFQLAAELGLPVVATNDAHYLRREDAEAHDVLLAIGTGKDLDDPKRFRFDGQESYVKSESEMVALFPDRPDVIAETARVAARCEFDFERRYFLPEYPLPTGVRDPNELLIALATEGARARYGTPLPPHVEERLRYELGVITKTGYAGYFLIVADFIRAARERGIPVGPGRGSAAGSLVAYALHITNVDPLAFDLLFERFLNPDRVSMPDIDIDFCFERRGEVIDYVRDRFGRESVGQVVTFGTMKARAAVRDVARVLKIDLADTDRVAKLIPSSPGVAMSLQEAVDRVPELRTLVEQDERIAKLIRLAETIEGLSRHASVHAAGIVIAPGPLSDYVPVCTVGSEPDARVTQYDWVGLEQVGMLKMDFLGLKTLTVIHDATAMVAERIGAPLDLDALDKNDEATYAMLRSGRTAGVFQFESPLATDTLRNMRCDRFDDLVAANALLRPGPLDSGMHLVFINRKLGREPIRFPHPALREILEPTYGVITYQEQVMRIANVLAGFSLADADVLRKAVGKKDAQLIRQELDRFVARGVERGHDERTMEEIASQIETFGRYGFNKSHSVAYSILSFQTAWLKAHHPGEFLAALLSSEIGNADKIVQYIAEARELGIEVLPPDVNESGYKFTVVGDRRLRCGLGAIKNVGRSAIESILAGRLEGGVYRSLLDLCDRIDLRLCNKRVLEALIDGGACDSLPGHRASLQTGLDGALAEAQLRQAEREAGQASLFGEDTPADTARDPAPLPDVAEWPEADRLAREKAVLGFFISGHPLAKFREEVDLFSSRTTTSLGTWSAQRVTVGALVTAVKRQISRRSGSEYARLTLEDFYGTAEALVFPEAWARLASTIREDEAYLFTGSYSARDRHEERAQFLAEQARPLQELKARGAMGVALRWSTGDGMSPDVPPAVAALCAAHPGPAPVFVEWSERDGASARLRSRRLRVELNGHLLRALRDLAGEHHVHLVRAE